MSNGRKKGEEQNKLDSRQSRKEGLSHTKDRSSWSPDEPESLSVVPRLTDLVKPEAAALIQPFIEEDENLAYPIRTVQHRKKRPDPLPPNSTLKLIQSGPSVEPSEERDLEKITQGIPQIVSQTVEHSAAEVLDDMKNYDLSHSGDDRTSITDDRIAPGNSSTCDVTRSLTGATLVPELDAKVQSKRRQRTSRPFSQHLVLPVRNSNEYPEHVEAYKRGPNVEFEMSDSNQEKGDKKSFRQRAARSHGTALEQQSGLVFSEVDEQVKAHRLNKQWDSNEARARDVTPTRNTSPDVSQAPTAKIKFPAQGLTPEHPRDETYESRETFRCEHCNAEFFEKDTLRMYVLFDIS